MSNNHTTTGSVIIHSNGCNSGPGCTCGAVGSAGSSWNHIYIGQGGAGSGVVSPTTINTTITPHSTGLTTDIGNFLAKVGIHLNNWQSWKAKCSRCGEEKDIAITYKIAMERYICKDCFLRTVDKFIGVNIDPKTEEVLYGNK